MWRFAKIPDVAVHWYRNLPLLFRGSILKPDDVARRPLAVSRRRVSAKNWLNRVRVLPLLDFGVAVLE